MSKVFLVVGFNNWGKTRLLQDLFGKKRFNNPGIPFLGYNFLAIPQSNDDLGFRGYQNKYYRKHTQFTTSYGSPPQYVISAFCPTKETTNDSLTIINTIFHGKTIYMLLLEHKWCDHAVLDVAQITAHFRAVPSIVFHTITGTNATTRKTQTETFVRANLP